MFKHKFMTMVFSLSALGSLQNVQAMDPSNLAEEVEHYLKNGSRSQNFYPNIIKDRDDKTKETILSLQKQEEDGKYYWPEKEKQVASKEWLNLSEQNENDDLSTILYLSKALDIQWNGEVAIGLAKKCHQVAQFQQSPEDKFIVAYRGFVNLRVNLTEPDYDYHKKLRPAPQVISLLEDLKTATRSIQSLSNFSFFISPKIFPENCIPQAQVCTLLTVAYGADILLGLKDTSLAERNIFKNGKKAIKLCQKGLEGPTTLDQRKFYYTQIVNLVLGFSRTPRLVGPEVDPYVKLAKKSSLELARMSKDAHKESQGLQACCLAYDTALNYAYAGKRGKALKYIEIVSNVPPEETSERGIYIKKQKILAENLRLRLEGKPEWFSHQVQNWNVFGGD